MTDALYAHALALTVLGSHGRVQLDGTPWRCFIVEHNGLTIQLYPERDGPMLLTVDAPDRVLAVEFASLTDADASPVVLRHVPGAWQQRLFAAAKPRLK